MLPWLLLAGACSAGKDDPPAPKESAEPATVVPADLVAQTWQVRLAPAAARAPFEGRDSWGAYLEGRRLDALGGFAREGDRLALARAHVELAAAYALATDLAARATIEVYGRSPAEGDPAEVGYLLGVSGALLGLPEFRLRLGGFGAFPAVAAADAAWKRVVGRPAAPPWQPSDVAGGAREESRLP